LFFVVFYSVSGISMIKVSPFKFGAAENRSYLKMF
jgi:hypothetical protein